MDEVSSLLNAEITERKRRRRRQTEWIRFTITVALLLTIIGLAAATYQRLQRNGQQNAAQYIYKGSNCPAVQMPANMCPGVLSNGTRGAIRARDLGVPFGGVPGPLNAMTDVGGVLVGHSTLICGEGPLIVGQGPVRTGATAILPRGVGGEPVVGGFFSLSGNGEATGIHYLVETGCLIGPIVLTNTASVGTVHQSVIQFSNALITQNPADNDWFDLLPIVAETWDGDLNDIMGLHVQLPHVQQAILGAQSGPIAEGSVGGGTGMRAFAWKAGAGTASRVVRVDDRDYVVGVYVQANFGSRPQMLVAGAPVGLETADVLLPIINSDEPAANQTASGQREYRKRRDGSCIVIVATDAPLSATQVNRLAKRAALGYARTGGTGHTSSGDLFLAFATGAKCTTSDFTEEAVPEETVFLPMDEFFDAAVDATEEAIINSIVAAQNMTGINDNTIFSLPHDLLQSILEKYHRLDTPPS